MDRKTAARALGLFGVGLGLAELFAPRTVARLTGLQGRERLLRLFGLREIASGLLLLTAKRPERWLWTRVAGDALDGAVLAAGLSASNPRRGRTLAAVLAVAPVVALDFLASRKPQDDVADPSAGASPPSLLQPGWTEGWRTVNGVRLHVVEAGPADGPPLILLHGFPEFWWAWREQITPFADAGYHVIAPDMRGYNSSEAPEGVRAYLLDTLVADVVALADSYRAERFRLVAHDWGAVIGWRVATLHSDRLERVVLMDGPHPDQWGRDAASHPTQALRSTYVWVFQPPGLAETLLGAFGHAGGKAMIKGSANPGAFSDADLERYAEAWSHPGSLTAMLNYYRALRDRRALDPAPPITAPVLVLWAEKDAFLERFVAERALEVCTNGRLSVVPGASHWLHIEQPQRVNREVLAFLV